MNLQRPHTSWFSIQHQQQAGFVQYLLEVIPAAKVVGVDEGLVQHSPAVHSLLQDPVLDGCPVPQYCPHLCCIGKEVTTLV